tara:strand:+ start:2344 stop:2901 length:558 start_codon:yes stop_codon:yes gene_type:complete
MIHPHPEPDETPEDTMATYLGCLDVMLGRPHDRSALARRLVTANFSISDIKAMERVVKNKKHPHEALEKELKDLDQARIRVDDVIRHDAIRNAPKQPDAQSEPAPAMLQRQAYALVKADRKSPEYAAKEMGVDVAQIEVWVDQQRKAVYDEAPPDKKHIVEDTRTPKQRIDDFREFLAAKKQSST